MTGQTPQTQPPVLLETSPEGVATVRLNRPEAMNALDVETKELLLQTQRQVAEDPAVRCVVLTGSGRAFCVGQDLREHVELLQSADQALFATVAEHYNAIVELLVTMEKPVVAGYVRYYLEHGDELVKSAGYHPLHADEYQATLATLPAATGTP